MSALKITSIFFILLLYNCQTIDLDETKPNTTNTNNSTEETSSNNSLTDKESTICENDTAIFYSKGKYTVVLSTNTIPYIEGYRLPTKQEAKLLSNYINEDKRVLCIDNNIYYTFNYKSTIIKAGYKTEYYYIPIRSESTAVNINSFITIDTEWQKGDTIVLE